MRLDHSPFAELLIGVRQGGMSSSFLIAHSGGRVWRSEELVNWVAVIAEKLIAKGGDPWASDAEWRALLDDHGAYPDLFARL